MKKLLAILAIVMLAVPMFAGTGVDLQNAMWFSHHIMSNYEDQFNAPSTYKDGTTEGQGRAGRGWFHVMDWLMCGLGGTVYDGGDMFKVNFSYGHDQRLKSGALNITALTFEEIDSVNFSFDITKYYSLGIGMGQDFAINGIFSGNTIQSAPTANYTTGGISIGFQEYEFRLRNAINIPNVLSIFINYDNRVQYAAGSSNNGTDLVQDFNAGLSGSYSFGLSWGLSEEIMFILRTQNYHNTNPTAGTGSSGTFANQGVCLIVNDQEHNAWVRTPLFVTRFNLSEDIGKAAGLKDVSLSIGLNSFMKVHVPFAIAQTNKLPGVGYSYAQMPNTVINTVSKLSMNLGFQGVGMGFGLFLATQDTVNATVPLNGYAGSADPNLPGNNYYGGDRPNGRGQFGFQLSIGYGQKGWGFNAQYTGTAQIRDYDFYKDNFATAIKNGGSDMTLDSGEIVGDLYTGFYRWANQIDLELYFNW